MVYLVLGQEVNVFPSSTFISVLAQLTSVVTFLFNPSLFWFSGGFVFCLIELFLPNTWAKQYKLIPVILGVNALIVAFFAWRYTLLQDTRFQIAYWMALSTACVIWVRPMLLKRKKVAVLDATEAQTLTEILPGQTGKVLYEGCLWQGRTEGYQGTIVPHQKVYVLRREGNTLIVLPENLFQG